MGEQDQGASGGASSEESDHSSWHAWSAEKILEHFETDSDKGLDAKEVAARRERFGANRLTSAASRSTLMRLANQFNNLFIYLLIVAGIVTAVLGEWLDSGVIFAVVVIIAIIGFIQEGRAERALEAVQGMLTRKARVLREGRDREIDAEELVPGDIVLFEAGAGVPADIRILERKNLQAQEAALTGESEAVHKQVEPVDEDAGVGDRHCMLFSGTLLTTGRGKGVVVASGDATEIGRISGMLSSIPSLKTPLLERMDDFTRVLSMGIIALAAVTFAIGLLVWGGAWGELFFAAVSIAVAAIPEGLPAVMTVTLAIGVQRMAKRNAIIRRLPAVETLGSVTVICSDKTGTLTRNEMTVRTLCTADSTFETEGVGYAPEGGFLRDGEKVDLAEHVATLDMVRTGMLCNDAHLLQEGDRFEPDGDPTEAALIVLAHKAGFDPDEESETWRRLDVLPFASESRYMATLDVSPEGDRFVHVKGGPERVLEMCSHARRGDDTIEIDADFWHERVDAIAARGQRLLAVARKTVSDDLEALDEEEAESGLTLLGLFGLIDPPRDEAIAAVAACQSAGIRVIMITGDHALTAGAIARELGIERSDEVLTGRELEDLDDTALRERVRDTDVFARASPEHKLRLVKALQADGEVTAMTGDGVNDAPALKRADIGIAMGQKGTDAAREASAMVLADDNFASIERAVEEGRTVYDNLKKAILFILPTNVAQALVIVSAIVIGAVMPVTPVQILWVNMITAVTLGLAFAWERAEGKIMKLPPRDTEEPLLTRFMLWRIGLVGLLLLLGVGLLFMQEQGRPATDLEYARTLAVNALVMGQIAYLLNARFFDARSYTLDGLFGSRVVLGAIGVCLVLQLMFTYAPFMQLLFDTRPLDADAWMRCIAVALAVFVLVEVEKAFVRRRNGRLTAEPGAGGQHAGGEA
ncbi:MAG: HAD family hydrolase [Gammaproteobacteria bacterium]|nr:MAG: HAD family hydrolase [Gammaproteobacteria bacterium]